MSSLAPLLYADFYNTPKTSAFVQHDNTRGSCMAHTEGRTIAERREGKGLTDGVVEDSASGREQVFGESLKVVC